MTCSSSERSSTDTLSSVINVATQNARRCCDIAVATTHVVAKRVALGIAAAFDPLNADHHELALMVPEKVKAFSASGLVMLQQSREANQNIMRLASDDVMTTVRATIEIADCSNPMALAEAHGTFARGCFSRAASSLINMGMLTLSLQAAAMAPIYEAVVANAERLRQ